MAYKSVDSVGVSRVVGNDCRIFDGVEAYSSDGFHVRRSRLVYRQKLHGLGASFESATKHA